MNLPRLPTDNLYKFMAVCGLAAVIAAHYFARQVTRESRQEISSAFADRVKRKGEFLREFHQRASSLAGDVAALQRLLENEKEEFDAVEDKQAARLHLYAEFVRERIETRLQVLLWGGVAATVMGFSLWWSKVQRFQDAVTRAQWWRELTGDRPTFGGG